MDGRGSHNFLYEKFTNNKFLFIGGQIINGGLLITLSKDDDKEIELLFNKYSLLLKITHDRLTGRPSELKALKKDTFTKKLFSGVRDWRELIEWYKLENS